jgi:hypothetical protein
MFWDSYEAQINRGKLMSYVICHSSHYEKMTYLREHMAKIMNIVILIKTLIMNLK